MPNIWSQLSEDLKGINEKVLLEFGEKCGQKLQNIDLRLILNTNYKVYDYKPLLKLCPNIRSLTNIRLFDIIENNDLLVPKLMSVKGLKVNSDIEMHLFETFVNKTENNLKCLGIQNNIYNNEDSGLKQLKKLTNYVNLEELSLYFDGIDANSYKAFVFKGMFALHWL